MPPDPPCRIGSLDLRQPLAIGTMQWGTTRIDRWLNRGIVSDENIDMMFEAALEAGLMLDTAEGYGGGTSEERIRDAEERYSLRRTSSVVSTLQDPGKTCIVATKFLPTPWRWTKESFFRALRGSATRLGRPCVDLYFIHSPTHLLPLEIWVEAACDAKDSGLLKEIGLSNCNAEQVLRAVAAATRRGHKIAANQVMFNLLDYSSPKLQQMLSVCRDQSIAIIGFMPIGQGLLTENLSPETFRKNRGTMITGVTWDEVSSLRGAVVETAARYGKTMTQVCLNWSICNGVIPLVGCKTNRHMQDALGSLGWRLTPSDVTKLNAAALNKSTLEKSRVRRSFFVGLISLLILSYRVDRWLRPALRIAR